MTRPPFVRGDGLRLDLSDAEWLRESLKDLLDYPIGADQICSIGKRYPNEVVTLRHCQFPHMVIFDAAVYREAKACAASGARVRLTIEGSKDGRTKILTKVERV